jgi:hypothetical protein
MPIVLAGATSGSATIQATDAQTVTMTLPATSGTLVTTGGAQTIEFADGTVSAPSITNSGDTNTGIFFPAADTIAFSEGGTESMRISSAGNLGIGQTSPSYRLDINKGSAGIIANFTDGVAQTLRILTDATTASIDSTSGTNLGFQVGSSEKMRIDSSGNVLVGATATSNNAKFFVSGSVADRFVRFNNSQPSAPFGVVIEYTAAAPNDTGKSFLFCADNSATRADIRSNGGLANYSANNVNLSDAREKTNVELAGSYLDKICAIPVKTFNYIDQNRDEDDGLTLGVIAQDVQAVAPELVSESDWGTTDEPKMRLAIYQTDLQYALMKCIQEQQALITDLKARIETLENT